MGIFKDLIVTGVGRFLSKVYASEFVGKLTGNADSATKLKTPRTINSTSFDGSADITTAKWGMARIIKIGDSSKSVDGSLDVTWGRNEIGAVYGWEKYGETPSTAGWYRVAQSVKHINDNIGTFYIQNGLGGSHTVAAINAGIAFGWSDGVTLIQTACSYYGRMGITKARIVYNTTYANAYAYLEIYCPNAAINVIFTRFVGTGWVSVAPSTAGSIPDGYTSKEITLVGGNNYMVGNLSGYASSAGFATTAGSATKATQDSDGNQINTTYVHKSDITEYTADDIQAMWDEVFNS